MKRNMSRKSRRIFIVLNCYFLIMIPFCFFLSGRIGWNIYIIVGLIISLTATIFTSNRVHFRTGLWKLVHTKSKDLDERQIQLTYWALQISYKIYSITSLTLLFAIALYLVAESRPFLLILLHSMIFLAHSLPASVIGWTEREV